MARRHWSEVKDLPYSDTVKCYLACQMELELALESLMDQLEQAGKLENTVIVLSADHYPYGLTDEEYSEARHIHLRLAPVCKALFEEGNPAGIKAALHAKGIIACGKLRDPLCSVSSALYEKLSSLVCRQH